MVRLEKRALANGVAIGGAAIGAVISPPLTIFLSATYGWRWSFVVPGLIGVVWVVVWLLLPKPLKPESVPGLRSAPGNTLTFLTILRNRQALTFITIRFLLDPVVFFIMFSVPKYLNEARNVSFERIGELFWIPFLALGISNIAGGWFSDKLVGANFTVNKARKTVMGIAAGTTLSVFFIPSVATPELAVALMALFMFAQSCKTIPTASDPVSDPISEKLKESDVEVAARVSIALQRFVRQRDLDGLAYYYDGEADSLTSQVMSNLAVGNSLLTGAGFPMCGESDLKTCIAMFIMDRLGIGGSFAEFHPVDFKENFVLVGHDGPHNITIAQGKPVLRSLKKYHGKPGFGAGVEFKIKEGPITMLSIGSTFEGKFKFVIAEGTSVAGPIPPTGNTNTRGLFKPDVRTF